MASRTGILSNESMEEECIDYKELPLGYINSEYSGNLSNPFLQGIKTPKYQRAAPKPASADVVATSVARLVPGNRQVNARKILDAFQRDAKEWKPPPVNLATVNRIQKDVAIRQAVSILPRASSGQTLGSAITKQTIGINNQDLAALQQRYISHYAKLSRESQIEIGNNLIQQLDKDGIEQVYHGDKDGYIYNHLSGNAYRSSGAARDIDAVYQTPDFDFGDVGTRKTLKYARVSFSPEGAV